MSSNFGYQPFVAVSGNFGGKVPVVDDFLSFHEQGINPATSLDQNGIEFEFQTDHNPYVDWRQTSLALKPKFVRGFGYETCKEVKKEQQEEAKMDVETTAAEDDEEAPVPLVTHVNI